MIKKIIYMKIKKQVKNSLIWSLQLGVCWSLSRMASAARKLLESLKNRVLGSESDGVCLIQLLRLCYSRSLSQSASATRSLSESLSVNIYNSESAGVCLNQLLRLGVFRSLSQFASTYLCDYILFFFVIKYIIYGFRLPPYFLKF